MNSEYLNGKEVKAFSKVHHFIDHTTNIVHRYDTIREATLDHDLLNEQGHTLSMFVTTCAASNMAGNYVSAIGFREDDLAEDGDTFIAVSAPDGINLLPRLDFQPLEGSVMVYDDATGNDEVTLYGVKLNGYEAAREWIVRQAVAVCADRIN